MKFKLSFIFLFVTITINFYGQSTVAGAGNVGSGTAPTSNEFLGFGTGYNYNLIFKTGGTERMRILHSNGNFGINVIAPVTKLHVGGDALFSSLTAPVSAAYIRAGGAAYSVAALPDYIWFNNLSTGVFHPGANIIGFSILGGEKIRIHSNGFIGFGTTAPLFKAHINGDLFVTGTGGAYPYGGLGNAGSATMYFGDTDIQPQWGVEYADPNFPSASVAGGLNFWRPAGSAGIGGNYVLFLKNDSKIGIHTGNPTADLTVNGNVLIGDPSAVTNLPTAYKLYVQSGILTEKVKVALYTTSDWSDYVFDKEYKLRSLMEVNDFIKINKHLPGVPSANDLVEQGGFDLGKMDAKLLEKIEELTLYIIQLGKENKELADRLTKLESNK
jgi:hypothetical protein